MMTLELVASSDENVVAAPMRDDYVIGNEAMSALDEIEHQLGFSDSTSPGEKQSDTEHVSERPVQRRHRRELTLENGFYPTVELGRLEPGSQKCDSGSRCSFAESRRKVLTLRHDYCGKRKPKKRRKNSVAVTTLERREISNLGFAENLQSLTDEPVDVPCEREPGTRDFRAGYDSIEPPPFAHVFELQRITAALEELPDSN
jgi:hypothetical protein